MQKVCIGELIKKRRTDLNLTQEELCLGICDISTMSRLENGKITPSYGKLKVLLERLGLPSEKYYALLSKKELEIENLQLEISSYNMRNMFREALEKIQILESIIEDDDQITKQFIIRSTAFAGKLKDDKLIPFSSKEKLNLLIAALKLTLPDFDFSKIRKGIYSTEEIKIMNLIASA